MSVATYTSKLELVCNCALFAIVAKIYLLLDGDPTTVVLDHEKVTLSTLYQVLGNKWDRTISHTEHSMACSGKKQ